MLSASWPRSLAGEALGTRPEHRRQPRRNAASPLSPHEPDLGLVVGAPVHPGRLARLCTGLSEAARSKPGWRARSGQLPVLSRRAAGGRFGGKLSIGTGTYLNRNPEVIAWKEVSIGRDCMI